MPFADVDVARRRCSIELPSDGVDLILYSYNEYSFEEKHLQSVDDLLKLIENEIENEQKPREKYYWLEVINRSCVDLPENIQRLCEHFDIHALTIEDIGTLTSYTKLDFFNESGALYLVMKLLTWNDQRIQQQQISFYLKCSQNLLITFQEKPTENIEPFFQTIRHRLRRQQQNNDEQSQQHLQTRLRQLNVDYLFYCLFDDIIHRYMLVMEKISARISQFDEILMTDAQSRTLTTLSSLYRFKHDLLHLRILFNPLKEILSRLQRATSDDPHLSYRRTDPSLRLGLKHLIVRRQAKAIRPLTQVQSTSIYLNEYIYVYLNDLNNHIDQLIDSLEIQRESISILISFWITLNSNEIQEILQILMLMTVLFMPCTLLTGNHSTNFHFLVLYHYPYGYYISLALVAFMLTGMIIWYKVKHWI